MEPTSTSKSQHGRKTVLTIARKGGPALLQCLHAAALVQWLADLVGNDDAANPTHSRLTAVIKLGKVLFGLSN